FAFTTVVPWWQIMALESQVAQTVGDRRQQSRVLDQLLAREGLMQILTAAEAQAGRVFDLDIHAGLSGKLWRLEVLGILDLLVNGWLVGVYPTTPAASRAWFSRAQLKAHTAPDFWAVVSLAPHDDGLLAVLRGGAAPARI